jgi:hypothetical protein
MPKYPKWSFPLKFPTKTLIYTSSITNTCHMPCLSLLLDFITWLVFGEVYRSWTSSLHSLLQSSVTSSL